MFRNNPQAVYYFKTFQIWFLLAFQGGAINAGGFMACHRFVSHVTGFPTLFAVQASKGSWIQAVGILSVPVFFLFGAMLSALLVDRRIQLEKSPLYNIVFGLIFLLLIFVWLGGVYGIFGVFGAQEESLGVNYLLMVLLCLASGLQNASISTASGFLVRTTHLTGITTDLGIGIVRVLFAQNRDDAYDIELRATFLRIGTITFFIFGGICGAVLFRNYSYFGFIVPVLTAGALFFDNLRRSFNMERVKHA